MSESDTKKLIEALNEAVGDGFGEMKVREYLELLLSPKRMKEEPGYRYF